MKLFSELLIRTLI